MPTPEEIAAAQAKIAEMKAMKDQTGGFFGGLLPHRSH
jgi:hypothetical protein